MSKRRNIFYTAGSHGNFIKYLFDCHDNGKVLPSPFNENGNSHKRADMDNLNRNYDICSQLHNEKLGATTSLDNYAVVWEGFDSFFYTMIGYTDRGARLKQPGIELLRQDLKLYEKIYGVEVHISEFLKQKLNYDIEILGQPPLGVIRNYFLMSFYTHFNHILWLRNQQLKQKGFREIPLFDILDKRLLKSRLKDIFGFVLDIDAVHQIFMSKNLAYEQLQLVTSTLKDISDKNDRSISGLNVISEAYILFCLEVKHFDIPFSIGNEFFKTTKDVVDYIDHFPGYMKRPNNLFHEHFRHYKRKDF